MLTSHNTCPSKPSSHLPNKPPHCTPPTLRSFIRPLPSNIPLPKINPRRNNNTIILTPRRSQLTNLTRHTVPRTASDIPLPTLPRIILIESSLITCPRDSHIMPERRAHLSINLAR